METPTDIDQSDAPRPAERITKPLIVMPDGIVVHNASHESCDMAEGPCCCGAWHHLNDWPEPIRSEIRKVMVSDKKRLDCLEENNAKVEPRFGDSDWIGIFWKGRDTGGHSIREAIDAAIEEDPHLSPR